MNARTITVLGAVLLLALAGPARARELGLNVHQSTGVGLNATRDAGLTWVRVDFNWLDAQPTNAAPDFTLFDQIVDGARARGLSVLATVGYTPAWASVGDTKSDGSTNDVPTPGAYEAFVKATVDHFKDRVDHYELWNEPNLGTFWEGTSQQYIDLVFKPGADAVHASCPKCLVVGPALATVGTTYADFLDAVLTQAGDKLDIVSGHDYAGFPSSGSSTGTTSDSFFNKLDAHRVVKIGGATIYEGPLSFYEVMQKHNVQKPFWMDETGLEAALGDAAKESAQATYYSNVIDAMSTRPWWTVTIFYEAFDEPPAPYHFGVVVDNPAAASGYDPKPVFSVLKTAATQPPPDLGMPPASDGGVPADAAAPPVDAAGTASGGDDLGPTGSTPPDGTGASSGCAMAGASTGAGPFLLLALALLVVRARRRC